ncbi:hypothetical protein FUSO6_07260 [Fusobacterium necrophorum DAB]|uniref:Uncharacterized protein n=1 Tax=Fusobacterium necrophorum BL TaxID=1441732 RepID=A0AB73BW03_9FUSO|nr:hypothetical protein [Fusobacterium necrophorum]KDE62970.1 hypothetical protein FUSO3_06440 [Fusobacterium necrophorum BL]KDE67916.1 hypothetical protein FUSO7_13720 [Fusobacterium necrophorum BFTR-2]KDE69144.1 hypothetical protein FUSO6_07260 [Fusobacterium necrophorum DAB]
MQKNQTPFELVVDVSNTAKTFLKKSQLEISKNLKGTSKSSS